MAKDKKPTKKKPEKIPEKYKEKFKVDGTFEEIMKRLIKPNKTINNTK